MPKTVFTAMSVELETAPAAGTFSNISLLCNEARLVSTVETFDFDNLAASTDRDGGAPRHEVVLNGADDDARTINTILEASLGQKLLVKLKEGAGATSPTNPEKTATIVVTGSAFGGARNEYRTFSYTMPVDGNPTTAVI